MWQYKLLGICDYTLEKKVKVDATKLGQRRGIQKRGISQVLNGRELGDIGRIQTGVIVRITRRQCGGRGHHRGW